jgi:molybdate transport system permease protein
MGEFGATLMLAGNIPGKTQTMPLAIYEAFLAGEDRQARALALILTTTSLVTIYLTNILTRPPKSA